MSLVLSYDDADLYENDVKLFSGKQWLNDSCINFCFRRISSQANNTSILFMDPSVVSFLTLQCNDDDEYESLAKGIDINNRDWLIVPINDNESFLSQSTHWSLLLVNIGLNTYIHYDSSSQYNCSQYNYTSTIRISRKISRLLNG